ncbi:hypothetical protein [Rummeliibacillus sp. TYF-LIM-RU47]|uniref:hypothetical protein n=1 Tax=Rummeliibacillus sp. TYF-LIM-RU47 TaxID=2608406 RepID=UPI00123B084F|nr:hypothetical protein [Rummeliibacillus sp. TYF-LIM-RU47]
MYKIIQVDKIEAQYLNQRIIEGLQKMNGRINSNNYEELFVALKDSSIEGIGISWTNSNHPTAKYIDFCFAIPIPQLMERLLKYTAPHNKVILSCWEDEIDKIGIAKESGFSVFRKTYMERYSIKYIMNRLQATPIPHTGYSLREVLKDARLTEDLFRLLKHNYEQTHLANEAKDVSWELWREKLLNDNPDLDLSYIIVNDNQISAYMFLHKTEDYHYEVGWMGKRRHVDILPGLLKKQLIDLEAEGIQTVEFEIDTTDYFAYEFCEILDLKYKKSWDSFLWKTNR